MCNAYFRIGRVLPLVRVFEHMAARRDTQRKTMIELPRSGKNILLCRIYLIGSVLSGSATAAVCQ